MTGRIAIVGGGITGLATAWFLRRRGVSDVVLFEASDRFGGNIRTERHGDLTLDVDGTKVTGTSEGGALGAAVIDGTTDGTTLTANVRRKDPADQGLMGTIIAKVAGDKVEGTMRLSDANAAAVREATFSAAKK